MHSTTSWWVISRGCWLSPGETSCKEGAPPKTTKKHCCGCYQIAVVARSLHGRRQQTSCESLRYLWTLKNCALQAQQTYFKRLLLWKQVVSISGFHRTLSVFRANSRQSRLVIKAITSRFSAQHSIHICGSLHLAKMYFSLVTGGYQGVSDRSWGLCDCCLAQLSPKEKNWCASCSLSGHNPRSQPAKREKTLSQSEQIAKISR